MSESKPTTYDLPEEILEEILRRLPARDLMKACLVCKQWRDVIAGRRLFDLFGDALCPDFGHYDLDSKRRYKLIELFCEVSKRISIPPKDIYEMEELDIDWLKDLLFWVKYMPNLKVLRTNLMWSKDDPYAGSEDQLKRIFENETLEELTIQRPRYSSEFLYYDYQPRCSLKILNISGITCRDLPLFICKIKSLEVLKCSSCSIEYVWRDIGDLVNLKELDLSHNKITYLPPTIGRLKKLKRLDISNCDLYELPPEIGGLESLECLDISDLNNMTFIPQEIMNLNNLTDIIPGVYHYLERSLDAMDFIYDIFDRHRSKSNKN